MTNLASAIAKQGGANMAARRDKLDRYDTPEWATRALMDQHSLLFGDAIHEPAAGAGMMARVLSEYVAAVTASDLEPRWNLAQQQDFLTETRRCRNIVTNPPYGIATEFLHKGLELAYDNVAMLVGLNFLASRRRGRMFREGQAPSHVMIFERRINFIQANGEPIKSQAHNSCWMIWNAAKCRRRAALPEATFLEYIP